MLRRREFTQMMPAALAQGKPRIKAALLGASHSHASEKLRLVQESMDFELAGAWEPDPKVRASYEKHGVQWLERGAILSDKSIHAVFIESDVKSHGPLAIEALTAGKHCHVEKPPAEFMRDMHKIAGLAKGSNLQVQSGYMWRHNPAVEKALEAAKAGWLGDIYLVHARMNTLIGADRRPEWNLFSGGQMFEQGSHLIDIVVRLLGKPERVTPFLRHDGAFPDTLKDNTAAVLEYPRAMAVITAGVLQPAANPHRTVEIFGSSGSAVLRPIEPPSLEMDLATPAGPYPKGKQRVTLASYERYRGDIAAFAAAIRGENPLPANLEQELMVQEIVLIASGMLGAA